MEMSVRLQLVATFRPGMSPDALNKTGWDREGTEAEGPVSGPVWYNMKSITQISVWSLDNEL
jgi:hypothetical protein